MRLTTAKAYVQAYGVSETGRLLSNKGVITPAGDDRSNYLTELFTGGNEDNELKDGVKAELHRYIDDAQTEIVPRIRRYLVWPLQKDGFQIGESDVPTDLAHITREVARYYLHDEDVRGVEEVSFIERRYRHALQLADQIGAGEHEISGVDSKYEDQQDQIIYSL